MSSYEGESGRAVGRLVARRWRRAVGRLVVWRWRRAVGCLVVRRWRKASGGEHRSSDLSSTLPEASVCSSDC